MIVLNHVEIYTFQRKANGRKMFKWRKPTVHLTKMPGDTAYLYIDFLERWNVSHTGGGYDKRHGHYETIGFDNDDPYAVSYGPGGTAYDGFEIKLYFNKKCHIIGQNDKKCWYGIVQSDRSWRQVHSYKNTSKKNSQYIELGKRRKP